MLEEWRCAVCTTVVVVPSPPARPEAGAFSELVCAMCSERLVDRWAGANPGLPMDAWLGEHDLSASCIFWHANPDATVKATRCDRCVGALARHCNQPLLGKDPHNIIPGRCGAFDCCCDGNLVVDTRGPVDGMHSRCRTFRRRDVFRRGSRLLIVSE